jgi:hypothetical protein
LDGCAIAPEHSSAEELPMQRILAWGVCVTAIALVAIDETRAMSEVQGFTMPTWLSGTWTGADGPKVTEETWSTVSGNSMVGMWRLVESGKAKVFELSAMTLDDDGEAKMQLHHFNADGSGWEDKDKPTVLGFMRQTKDSFAFEGNEGQDFVRITYAKTGATDLTVSIEKNPAGPNMSTSSYKFHKKK